MFNNQCSIKEPMIKGIKNSFLKRTLVTAAIVLAALGAGAQQATWIWYPGDFDIWLGNQMQNRRTERGTFFPPFWRMDSHYVLIDFHKTFHLAQQEQVALYAEGDYNVKIDGKAVAGRPASITVPAGEHRINIKVYCQEHVPAVYVKGNTIVSDSSWLVTYEDKEWIDASGKTSDQSGTSWLNAGCWNLDDPQTPPSQYKLKTEAKTPVKIERNGNRWLVDFGKETFGYIKLEGLRGKGKVHLYYGESREEALSTTSCETLDEVTITQPGDKLLDGSRAFRYVNIRTDDSIILGNVSMLYEYAPVTERGSFRCSDTTIDKIYSVAKYTLHLNTREFFIDGIKRDRWIWSGDACQSYLMNYYLFFDAPTVSRTLLALRGKDPVTSHINTIMDYTFYWFLGIHDYYQYTGDKKFIEQFYPRMQSLMDYCLSRRDKEGLMEGLAGDWVFIDWADGLSKQGAVSFEQLLFCRSLETMATCAGIVNDKGGAEKYARLAADLKKKIFADYWNESKQALVHSRVDGQPTTNITRYANMFAIFFNYLTEAQKQGVKNHVLLNDSIPKIVTPYMRFYELEALCAMGEQAYVLDQMKDYWGGMLSLGATSFWEEYNPAKQGAEHYAMYGRPFGKSLCHAWGASPIYLLGKYYLGVTPVTPGYATYTIAPALGGLQWMQGSVPTPKGDITVYCDNKKISVQGAAGMGTLKFKSKIKPVCKEGFVKAITNTQYELNIGPGKTYTVLYQSIQ